jgi:hypothetical protein
MLDTTKNAWDLVLGVIQVLMVIVGAMWAYFRFRLEGPNQPRIEFGVDCRFFGPVHGDYLAAFEIHANNKGHVEHKFKEIRLKVLGIKQGEKLTEWPEHEPRLYFPDVLVRGVNLVPKNFGYYFVRPGVDQTFSFATKVSTDYRFLVARATFVYEPSADLHTAERVFDLHQGRKEN